MFVGEALAVFFIAIILFLMLWLLAGLVCLWLASVMGFRGEWKTGWVAGIVILGPLLLLGLLLLVGWWQSPTRLSRGDVVGKYEIDRSFYAGEQADWQHATYRIEITEEELILKDARTETVWRYPIEWRWAGRWCFQDEGVRHHFVRNGPTLYRQRFSHYYVFKSPHYGNVFLRRESRLLSRLVWGGGLVFLGLWLRWVLSKSGDE